MPPVVRVALGGDACHGGIACQQRSNDLGDREALASGAFLGRSVDVFRYA
jgi:hypothetical protein